MNRHRNLAFYVETLTLTLFVIVVLTLLVQLFGAAQRLGRQARRQTDAALILQNVTADFQAGAGAWADVLAAAAAGQADTVTCYYAADGTQQEPAAPDAYAVTVDLRPEPRQAGTMVQADVTVTAPDGTEVAALTTARYLPRDS